MCVITNYTTIHCNKHKTGKNHPELMVKVARVNVLTTFKSYQSLKTENNLLENKQNVQIPKMYM